MLHLTPSNPQAVLYPAADASPDKGGPGVPCGLALLRAVGSAPLTALIDKALHEVSHTTTSSETVQSEGEPETGDDENDDDESCCDTDGDDEAPFKPLLIGLPGTARAIRLFVQRLYEPCDAYDLFEGTWHGGGSSVEGMLESAGSGRPLAEFLELTFALDLTDFALELPLNDICQNLREISGRMRFASAVRIFTVVAERFPKLCLGRVRALPESPNCLDPCTRGIADSLCRRPLMASVGGSFY